MKLYACFPTNGEEVTLLNCMFRSSQDNKPYDMWFSLQFKRNTKNVSMSVFIEIITINIPDTLKG